MQNQIDLTNKKKYSRLSSGLAFFFSVIGIITSIIGLRLVSRTDINLDPWNLHIPDDYVYGMFFIVIGAIVVFTAILFRFWHFVYEISQ
tara:strand:+ start:66 stop:332 length:267 start_codon:yes stop_codon:yes gene_type:complete